MILDKDKLKLAWNEESKNQHHLENIHDGFLEDGCSSLFMDRRTSVVLNTHLHHQTHNGNTLSHSSDS